MVLAAPSPEPLKVEVKSNVPAPGCTDPASCEQACANGSGRACVRVAAASSDPKVQSEAWLSACGAGGNEGCTQLCAKGTAEQCKAAIATLYDVRSAWYDPRHAAALQVELCRKGDLEACSSAMTSLLLGPLGPGEFVTADAMLKEIRDEALLVQATAMRQLVLNRAREDCSEEAEPEDGAKACLFVAQAHTGGILAPRDPAKEEEALRRAGKFLRLSTAQP